MTNDVQTATISTSHLRVYNTLTRSKEEFTPVHPGKVGFYICGPTVYNHIHIGNARTFLSFDVIRRYLEYSGYEVTYVQNITDVDDKIINRAAEEGRTAAEVAAEYTQAFIDAMQSVGVKEPSIRPKATEEISTMIKLIECLVADGHAYAVEGDVYFAVRSFDEYGKLSGRNIDDLVSGARVDVDERKRDPLDFALWKAAKPGEPSWTSPWGEGRPGWHIECSAMSERYLGVPFDIHAGGEDLIFPHHENELAQSEACSSCTFARYWLHGGMLTIDKEKMSKSEGNFLLLKDVLEHVSPNALRLLMLQSHYRSPFDYSPERLEEAKAALERIVSALNNIAWALEADGYKPDSSDEPTDIQSMKGKESSSAGNATDCRQGDAADCHSERSEESFSSVERELITNTNSRFKEFMNDDFNTAGAVSVVFELVSEANRLLALESRSPEQNDALQAISDTVVELLAVLGIELEPVSGKQEYLALGDGDVAALLSLATELADYAGSDIEEALMALLGVRKEARSNKDWARADAVRDRLSSIGFTIEDTPQGTRVIIM